MWKRHLLSLTGLLSCFSGVAALGGFLLGGRILKLTGGSYLPVLVFDVLTNLGFITCIFIDCHLEGASRAERFAELLDRRASSARQHVKSRLAQAREAARQLVASMAEVLAFLRQRAQRPLLYLC